MGILYRYADFYISQRPVVVSESFVKPNEIYALQKIDHQSLILDCGPDKPLVLKIGIGLCGIITLLLLIELPLDSLSQLLIGGITFLVIFCIGLFLVIYSIKGPEKKVIFNRLNGMVEIPGILWGKPKLIHFDDLQVILGYDDSPSLALGIRRPKKKLFDIFMPTIPLATLSNDAHATWSLLVWYMDKNRPLPAGSALDPYRNIDEQRRATENHPDPIYQAYF